MFQLVSRQILRQTRGNWKIQDRVLRNNNVCFRLAPEPFLACLSLHLQQSNQSICGLGVSQCSSDWRHLVQNVRESFAHCLHLHLRLVCGSGTHVVVSFSVEDCIHLFLHLFSVCMRRNDPGANENEQDDIPGSDLNDDQKIPSRRSR